MMGWYMHMGQKLSFIQTALRALLHCKISWDSPADQIKQLTAIQEKSNNRCKSCFDR